MMPDVSRIVSVGQSGRSMARSDKINKDGTKPEGKNFLLSLMEQNDRNSKTMEQTSSSRESSSDDKKVKKKIDNAQEAKVDNVVNEMGLSYFFVLQEEVENQELSRVTLETKGELSINLQDASQLLAKLGFSSDDINSLQLQASDDGNVDLETLINFLSSHAPTQEGVTIQGDELSKILSGILFNGEALHFSLDQGKRFSLDEIKNILARVDQLPQEMKEDFIKNTLQKPSETILSSEISSTQDTGKVGQPEVYQRDAKDSFANTIISQDKNFTTIKTIDAAERLAGNYDSLSQAKPGNLVEKIDGEISEGSSSRLFSESDQVLETHTAIKSINSDTSSGFGDGGRSSQSFSFSQQPNANVIQVADTQIPMPGTVGTFSQTLNQVQSQPFQITQLISQTAVAPQLASYIQQMRQEGTNQLIIQLEPKELGRIVVKLSANDNKISTIIKTEQEEVSDLLRKNSEALKQYLEEQGLLLDEFSVETENSGGNEFNRQDSYKTAFSSSNDESTLNINNLIFHRTTTISTSSYPGGHLIYFYA